MDMGGMLVTFACAGKAAAHPHMAKMQDGSTNGLGWWVPASTAWQAAQRVCFVFEMPAAARVRDDADSGPCLVAGCMHSGRWCLIGPPQGPCLAA